MSANSVNIDGDTPLLFPVDMRDWVPAGDMVHFVIHSVKEMNPKKFRVNERGSGGAQYPPSMMLTLPVYRSMPTGFSAAGALNAPLVVTLR